MRDTCVKNNYPQTPLRVVVKRWCGYFAYMFFNCWILIQLTSYHLILNYFFSFWRLRRLCLFLMINSASLLLHFLYIFDKFVSLLIWPKKKKSTHKAQWTQTRKGAHRIFVSKTTTARARIGSQFWKVSLFQNLPASWKWIHIILARPSKSSKSGEGSYSQL